LILRALHLNVLDMPAKNYFFNNLLYISIIWRVLWMYSYVIFRINFIMKIYY
jgi:hypothetical protein